MDKSVPTQMLGAQIIDSTIPNSCVGGKSTPVSVTVKNTGTDTWTYASNIKLAVLTGSTTFNVSVRQLLNSKQSIAPGQTVTFSFNMAAPTTPGSYDFKVQMLKENVACFGTILSKNISVTTSPLNAVITQDTIPTSLSGGKPTPVTITVKNTGTDTWTYASNIKLAVLTGSTTFNVSVRQLLNSKQSIAPGQTVTFSFNMAAPTTPGSYDFKVQMLKENVACFGTILSKTLTI